MVLTSDMIVLAEQGDPHAGMGKCAPGPKEKTWGSAEQMCTVVVSTCMVWHGRERDRTVRIL